MLAGPRDVGDPRPLRAAGHSSARPTSSSAASSTGRSPRACGRSCASARCSRTARPAGEIAVVDGQLAGALDGRDPARAGRGGPRDRLRARLGDRDRAATRRGADAAAMADAIRASLDGPRAGATAADDTPVLYGGSVTSANIGGVPRRARRSTAPSSAGRRSSPTRWPGSSPGPASRPRPAASPRDGSSPARRRRRPGPRPIVLVVLDGFGIGRDPAADAIAARRDAPLARAPRALAARGAPASEGAVGLPAGPDGQLGGRPPEPRRRAARAPGPAADRRGDRGRVVRRAPGAARRLRAGARDRAASTRWASSGPAASTPTTATCSRSSRLAARARRPVGPRPRAARRPRHAAVARRSGSSATSRRGSRRSTPTRGSRRSAAATGRWTATSAGSGSSAATTRSSTARATTRRRRPPRSRRPTPAARPTSSSPRR